MIKNGKLFGKINIFDFAVIFLIIALIVLGVTKFKTLDEKVDYHSQQTLSYQMVIKNVRDYTVAAYQSGDKVFDNLTGVFIGTITNVAETENKVMNELANGDVTVSNNPYRKDIYLTIETPGSCTDNGYFSNRTIELKVGNEKRIETKYAISRGTILSIEVVKEGNA